MIILLSFFSRKHAISKFLLNPYNLRTFKRCMRGMSSNGAEPPQQLCADCCVSVRRSSAPCGMTSRKTNRSFSASSKGSWSTRCPTYRTLSGSGKVWNKLFAGANPRKTAHVVKCVFDCKFSAFNFLSPFRRENDHDQVVRSIYDEMESQIREEREKWQTQVQMRAFNVCLLCHLNKMIILKVSSL